MARQAKKQAEQPKSEQIGKDPVNGRFLPGNRFWERRSSHGRNPIFDSPEKLWDAACQYFDWVENNPLYEMRGFAFQGVVTQEPFAKMRAMTITGMLIFIDISTQSWSNYCDNPDFLEVTTRITEIIRTQKFEGASAELLNANIIARDLGLTDSVKQTLQNPDGTGINQSREESLAELKAILLSAKNR